MAPADSPDVVLRQAKCRPFQALCSEELKMALFVEHFCLAFRIAVCSSQALTGSSLIDSASLEDLIPQEIHCLSSSLAAFGKTLSPHSKPVAAATVQLDLVRLSSAMRIGFFAGYTPRPWQRQKASLHQHHFKAPGSRAATPKRLALWFER